MKKIYYSILTFATALTISGQSLTQSNHAPANGELYSMKQCTLNVNPGGSGANTVWDFSLLNIDPNVVFNYTTQASTTSGYPAGCQATGSSLTDLAYTNSSPNDLKYFGGNFKVQSYSGTFTYNNGAVYAVYPMSLNTSSSNTIGGTLNVTSPALSGTFLGNSAVIADGTGTLMLPGRSAEVIRVVSTQTLNYTTVLVTGEIILKSVSYYSVGIKPPLLTISTKTITTSSPASTNTETVVLIHKDYMTVSLNKNAKADLGLLVYPNPSTNHVTFTTENQAQKDLLIYDVTGKIIEKQNFNAGNFKLDVSGYDDGFYLYSILNNIGQVIKTGKVAVSH